jgi:PilZ domain-containing protein
MSAPIVDKVLRAKQRGWRRRYPRYRANFPLTASAFRENGYQVLQGRCSDIGRGGMGVVLTPPAHASEVVTLEFTLSNHSTPLVLRAIVRYRTGFSHGLEFLGVTAEQQSIIEEFCATLEMTE